MRDVSTDSIKTYIDGQLDAEEPDTTSTAINVANQLNLVIGASNHASRGIEDYYKGLIDDLRIYNKALTVNEIFTLYNSTK